MGQCFGTDALRLDVKQFTQENEEFANEVATLRKEFLALQRNFINFNQDIDARVIRIVEAMRRSDGEGGLARLAISAYLDILKCDIIANHRGTLAFSSSYRKIALDMNTLLQILYESNDVPNEEKADTSPADTKSSGSTISPNWKKSMKRAATSIGLARKMSHRVVGLNLGDQANDHPGDVGSIARITSNNSVDQERPTSPDFKRSMTLPNLLRHTTIKDLKEVIPVQRNLGEILPVIVEKSDGLGLILKPYKRMKSGTNFIAQLIVSSYTSNGITMNPSFKAGVLVDDVICGVNGKFFSSADDLATALMLAYSVEEAHTQAVDLSLTFRGNISSDLSTRRMARAHEAAKEKLKSMTAVKVKESKRMGSVDKGDDGESPRSPHHHHHHVHHVRKEGGVVTAVKQCGCGAWKFIINRITTKSFRKALGKSLRKYCCKSGLGGKRDHHSKDLSHNHGSDRYGFVDVHADQEYHHPGDSVEGSDKNHDEDNNNNNNNDDDDDHKSDVDKNEKSNADDDTDDGDDDDDDGELMTSTNWDNLELSPRPRPQHDKSPNKAPGFEFKL